MRRDVLATCRGALAKQEITAMSEITDETLFWVEVRDHFFSDFEDAFSLEDFPYLSDRCLFWAMTMRRIPKEGLSVFEEKGCFRSPDKEN
jgi:hypothetical protein